MVKGRESSERFEAIRKKQEIEDRIRAEVKKLKRIFKVLDKDTQKVVQPLIENAAFMSITLEDLQSYINENGVTTEYQNGENQWGTKKCPEVEIHIQMTKNHTTIIRQLTDLVPKRPIKDDDDDGFDSFVSDRE